MQVRRRGNAGLCAGVERARDARGVASRCLLVVCRLGVSWVCLLVGVAGLDLDLVGRTAADLGVQQSGVYVPQLESRVTLDTGEARADARLQCLKKLRRWLVWFFSVRKKDDPWFVAAQSQKVSKGANE